MSPAKDQGYFADGIAEELLNALVRVDGLEVASRTSTFAFRGSALSIPEIARTLKVNHILEGSVRTSAERVRITAQLIDVRTDRHVWSEIHDRELTDIFAVQDEIARAIVTALKVEMRVGDDKPLAPRRTTSAEAYDIYLRGVQLLKRRKEATIMEAIELFKEATSIDPQFASAWSNLAVAYVVINIYRVDQDPAVRGLGLEAANRSLAIDPKNSSAIVWYAAAFAQTGYLIEARRYQDRAYALEPGYGQNAGWAAVFRHLSGDRRRVGSFEAGPAART